MLHLALQLVPVVSDSHSCPARTATAPPRRRRTDAVLHLPGANATPMRVARIARCGTAAGAPRAAGG